MSCTIGYDTIQRRARAAGASADEHGVCCPLGCGRREDGMLVVLEDVGHAFRQIEANKIRPAATGVEAGVALSMFVAFRLPCCCP
jgi:hypothetical protein